MQNGTVLLVATSLNNTSSHNAYSVTIDSFRFGRARAIKPAPFPIRMGEIDAGLGARFQVSMDGAHLTPGEHYHVVAHGHYRWADHNADSKDHHGSGKNRDERREEHHDDEEHEFDADTDVILPPAAPGSTPVQTTTAPPNKVSGAPYPAQAPSFDADVNTSRWIVPTGPYVPGIPTPIGTLVQNAPIGDPPGVTFSVNSGLGINSNSTPIEPSGASGGGVVFVTANRFAAYSINGGTAWTQLDPTTIFPADAVGFCCDQIVQYAPSIDRFIWLLQGNGYRLATASPADIINSKGTAWTYWNLTPDIFGQAAATGVDYPDLSLGNNALYTSWDVPCGNSCGGLQVSRISLAGLQAGGTIGIDYTTPSDSSMAWGAHLMQDTGDEIFWAGHNNNSNMRIFSLAEGSNTYFWRDVDVSTWANNSPITSLTPDNQNWLNFMFNPTTQNPGGGFPNNAVLGATRSNNQLWFAWSAGTDSNFQQPHVEMVTLDRNNNFSKMQQVQIWNNSYAFSYPALATNACTGEVGLSFEFGGNGNYENHVVGFWGDYVAYITTGSDVGSTRYGDYATIRQNTDPALHGEFFDAFGYGLNTVPATGATQSDTHYVRFGRGGACSVIIK
jgi:hypothetical protein